MKITLNGILTIAGAMVALGYCHATQSEQKSIETLVSFNDQHQHDHDTPLEDTDISYILSNFDTHWAIIDELDQEIKTIDTDLSDSSSASRVLFVAAMGIQKTLSKNRLETLMVEMERRMKRI